MRGKWVLFLLGFVTFNTSAQEASDDHLFITRKIAEYMLAFERCDKAISNRSEPREEVIWKLKTFPRNDVERFLISRSVQLRKQCEKPELTELAYAILTLQDHDIPEETRNAIDAIKVLAFPGRNRQFERAYAELPQGTRDTLERIDYFREPFDDRRVRDLLK